MSAPKRPTEIDKRLIPAYRSQHHNALVTEARLGKVVGFKIALTSLKAQASLGVHTPQYGHMHSSLVDGSPGRIDLGSESFCVELEVAIKVSSHGVTAHAALEIIDAERSFASTPDDAAEAFVITNSAFVRAIIADAPLPVTVDVLDQLHGRLEIDGRTVAVGEFVNVFGGPMTAYRWLQEQAEEACPAEVVLTGSCLRPVPIGVGSHVRGVIATATGDVLGTVEAVVPA